MDEKQTKKETEPKAPVANTDNGDEPKELTESQKLKAENDRMEKLLVEQKDFSAQEQLAGRGTAGQAPIPKAPETDEEYAERFQKGQVDLMKTDDQ